MKSGNQSRGLKINESKAGCNFSINLVRDRGQPENAPALPALPQSMVVV
jgi:hypothetical protein